MQSHEDVAEPASESFVWVEPLTGTEIDCSSFDDFLEKAYAFMAERDRRLPDRDADRASRADLVEATRAAVATIPRDKHREPPPASPAVAPHARPRERRYRRTARTRGSRGDPDPEPPGLTAKELVQQLEAGDDDAVQLHLRRIARRNKEDAIAELLAPLIAGGYVERRVNGHVDFVATTKAHAWAECCEELLAVIARMDVPEARVRFLGGRA